MTRFWHPVADMHAVAAERRAAARPRRGLARLGHRGPPLPRRHRRALVRERRLRARGDRRGSRRADAASARVLALRRRLLPTHHAPRRADRRRRADGRRGRLLRLRRRRVDRDRRQDVPPLLEPRRAAGEDGDRHARALLPRPRRLRDEHRRHRGLQDGCRPARGGHHARGVGLGRGAGGGDRRDRAGARGRVLLRADHRRRRRAAATRRLPGRCPAGVP